MKKMNGGNGSKSVDTKRPGSYTKENAMGKQKTEMGNDFGSGKKIPNGKMK